MNDQVHHSAAAGYKTAADTYIKGRPDYPPQVSQWLTQTLGLDSHKTVIDLGAGTGKFTGRLVATDAQVIAVEPVAQMLEKLSAAWPQVLAVSGTATDLPLPDASVDAVVCAQAFHWFATPEALSEIARVLKPGGKLGLIWNLRDTQVSWVPNSMPSLTRWKGTRRVTTPANGVRCFRIRRSGRCTCSSSTMDIPARRRT